MVDNKKIFLGGSKSNQCKVHVSEGSVPLSTKVHKLQTQLCDCLVFQDFYTRRVPPLPKFKYFCLYSTETSYILLFSIEIPNYQVSIYILFLRILCQKMEFNWYIVGLVTDKPINNITKFKNDSQHRGTDNFYCPGESNKHGDPHPSTI